MRGSIVSAANNTSYYKRRTQSNKINCAELHLLCMLTEMTHLLTALHNADQQGCLTWLPERRTVSKIHGPLKSWKRNQTCEERSNPKPVIAMIQFRILPNFKVDFLILPLIWVTFNYLISFLVSSHLFEYGCCQNPVFWFFFFFVYLQLWTSDSQGEDGEEGK